MLTRSMSPAQPPRSFTGATMKILAQKGSKELENRVKGDILEFVTKDIVESKRDTNDQNLGEEESSLIDINLIEWATSIYNFNRKEKDILVSPKVGTYNVYKEDQTTKIQNETIEFRINVSFDGMNETQVNNISCVFYDQANNNFSTRGVGLIERNVAANYLLCNSTHMSDFGAANIQNETATVLANANFEESTNFSELEEYQFYESTRICIYIYIYK